MNPHPDAPTIAGAWFHPAWPALGHAVFIGTVLCASLVPAAAQGLNANSSGEAPTPLVEAAAAPIEDPSIEPYLDRHVGSLLERFSRWQARMKDEHFNAYVSTYAAILGAVAGGIFSFLAYRFGDSMSPYHRSRNQAILLSLAIGAGLGVLVAVMQVPPTMMGKLTLLLRLVAISAVASMLTTLALFIVQRWHYLRRAKLAGFEISGRLRLP